MARKQAFTDKAILSLHAGKLIDLAAAGLSIEASAGSRTWRHYRRLKGSSALIRLRLGTCPAHELSDARAWADRLNEQVERGLDPRETERAAKTACGAAKMTVGEASALHWTDTVKGTRRVLKPRSLADKRGVWAGRENDLRLGIYGELGGLDWSQIEPNTLTLRWRDRPTEILRAGGPGLSSETTALLRTPAGHPEGFIEAFANVYRAVAAALRGGGAHYPGVDDGLRTMRFVAAVATNAAASEKWTSMRS